MKIGMNACTVILLFLGNTMAFYESTGYYPNVGTVLFTSSDTYRNTWTKNQVSLLRARRYFHTSIPPAETINSLNGDFIDKLLSYFKNSYGIIKKEASDPVEDTILTTALSDVIGGYLKVWALPITRYAYYGGSISSEKALQLHRFYKDVKNYLETDGIGWRDPDPNLLHSIEIKIAPRRSTNTRRTSDPCENLAFFEKSSTGLSVPIPYVNWDDTSCTMFIPLKNESLISLKSPETSDSLFRYYDTAKNCMETSNSLDQNKFDEKFQNWISKDVVPHLNDDNLYLAFGSILTLVNKTKSLCDTVIDMYTPNNNTREKFSIVGLPYNFSSKKMMIITIIIVLEIVWCIPALMYLVCVKRRKAKHNESNVYLYLDSKNRKSRRSKNIETSSRVEVDIGTDPDPTTIEELKFSQKPRRKNLEAHQKTVATECSCSFIAKSYKADAKLANYESRSLQLRPSLRKIKEFNNHILTSSREVSIYSPNKTSVDQCESYSTVQKLEATKTVTLIKENNNKGHSTIEIKSDHKSDHKDKKPSKQQLKIENPMTVASVTAVKPDENKVCPCTCCLEEYETMSVLDSNTTLQQSATVVASCSNCCKCSIKNSNSVTKHSKIQVQKETKPSKHRGVRVSCNKKPYLEITIDRQQRDICLEISGTTKIDTVRKDTTKKNAEPKPSKIPTRTLYCPGHANLITSKKTQSAFFSSKKKSLIPQLKKRPVDDSAIKTEKPAGKSSKLNVTL